MPEVETPILAWLKSVPSPPVRPSAWLLQCPVVAISTAPGLLSDVSQQPTVEDSVVELISGSVHQVAVRREVPPRMAETICQGGTCRFDGFEISTTPLVSVAVM